MSKTEDERLGLGWEVWFLLVLLAAGALVAIQVLGLLGAGFDTVSERRLPRGTVGIDLRRLLVGGSAAVALAGAATRLIVLTDWRLHPPTDPEADDRSF